MSFSADMQTCISTDDRTLLELAIKAAREYHGRWNDKENAFYEPDGEDYIVWNALTDHGDALRLAEKLKMTMAHEPSRGGWSVGAIVDGEFCWLAFNENCPLAIVMAASEIGKGTK